MPDRPKRAHSKRTPLPAGSKPVIGWREWIALPGLGVRYIKVKVDTGARTSALHAFNIRRYRKRGEDWIRFDIHPLQRDNTTVEGCTARLVDYRWVTNSGGDRQKRFVIKTPVRLGESEWTVEISLTDRDQLGFRMLLGRSAVKGRFMVDPGRSFCQGRRKRGKRRTGKSTTKRKNEE